VVVAVVALLLVGCGFLFWRLVEEPISLDFLTPVIVEAFDASTAAGSQATITGTQLAWDERRQSLQLLVTGFAVDDAAGQRSFAMPVMSIDFSFGRLLQGEVEVTEIEISGAQLSVRRDQQGDFTVLLFQKDTQDAPRQPRQILTAPGRAPVQVSGEQALSAINALLHDRDLGPISQLERVSLVDSQIIVNDQVLGFSWTLPADLIVLERTADGLAGEVDVGLPLGKEKARARLAYVYNSTTGTLDVAGQLADLDTGRLTALLPQVRGLSVVDTVLNGDVSATLGSSGRLFFVDFELRMGSGQLRPAFEAAPPVPITSGEINGRIDLAHSTLSIYRAVLQTGSSEEPGPRLEVAAEVTRDESGAKADGWDLTLTGTATPFPVTDLAWLWPAAYGSAAHSWVMENITDGTVSNLTAEAHFDLGSGGARNDEIKGSFGFRDLTLHYLRPMPPMLSLEGTTDVDLSSLVFHVAGGRSEGLSLGPGTVTISDLDKSQTQMLIEMPVAGSLSDMLKVLDEPRLRLISEAGIDRSGAEGSGRVRVTMGFPLSNDLRDDEIALKAIGTFTDVTMRRVVLGQDISARRIEVTSDMERLTIAGDVAMAGSDFQADYRQDYTGYMELKGSGSAIQASTIAAIVPEMSDRLGGKVASDFTIMGNPTGRLTIDVTSDLTNATLDLPLVEWKKAAGVRASVAGTTTLQDGVLRQIDLRRFDDDTRSLAGAFQFDATGEFSTARLSHFHGPEMTLDDVSIRETADSLAVDIGGGRIDARSWIETARLPAPPQGDRPGATFANTNTEIAIRNLQSVQLPRGALQNVQANVLMASGETQFDLTGSLIVNGANRGAVDLGYDPNPSGGKHAHLRLDDAGAFLIAMDLTDVIAGGSFDWQAQSVPGNPDGPITGTVTMRHFRLTQVPEALQVLMVAGLTGIEDALKGDGVSFDILTGDLSLDEDRLSTEQLRAVGSALGVLASGKLDVGDDTIDLSGKLVPAYAINRFLRNIPILGYVITGGKDQGLFAVNYDISGSLQDPKVTVNPLSALTPPILRSLVELVSDGSDSATTPSGIREPSGPQR